MNNGLNPIKTDVDTEREWVAALSDERINGSMHTTSLEDERAKYGNDADIMLTIVKCEINDLVAAGVDRINAERFLTEVQAQTVNSLADMLRLGNNAARNAN